MNRNFVIVNGSPRTSGIATSALLTELAEKKIAAEGYQTKIIDVRKGLKGDTRPAFEAMREADTILFVFPLYIFCLSGLLTRFMQDYAEYLSHNPGEGEKRVYAVVNCGFPEPDINMEAVRVIKSFCRRTGAQFGFGVCIGCGGMLVETKDASFMKPFFNGLGEVFGRIAKGETGEDVLLAPRLPRALYFMRGNKGWSLMSKKNGLKKKDLYRRPYAL